MRTVGLLTVIVVVVVAVGVVVVAVMSIPDARKYLRMRRM